MTPTRFLMSRTDSPSGTHTGSNSSRFSTSNKFTQKLKELRSLVRPPRKHSRHQFLKSPSTATTATPLTDDYFKISHSPDRLQHPVNASHIPANQDEYGEALEHMWKEHQTFPDKEQMQRRDEYPYRYAGLDKSRGSISLRRKPKVECMTIKTNTDIVAINNSGSRQRDVLSSQLSRSNPMSAGYQIGKLPSMPGLRSESMGGGRRTLSQGLQPPRPLSERRILPLDQSHIITPRTSGVLQRKPTPTPSNTSSTGSSTLVPEPLRTERKNRSAARRKQSINSMDANDGDFTDSDDPDSKPGMPSARKMRDMQATEDIHTMGGAAAYLPRRAKCSMCQEACKFGAGLCEICKKEFEPSRQVFDDTGSEYSDQSPCPSPKPLPSSPKSAFSKRTAPSLAPSRESWESTFLRNKDPQDSSQRGSQDSQQGSLSASPTPATAQVATQLKLTVLPTIRQVSIASPAKSPGGPSAFRFPWGQNLDRGEIPTSRSPTTNTNILGGSRAGNSKLDFIDEDSEILGAVPLERLDRQLQQKKVPQAEGGDGYLYDYYGADEDAKEEDGGGLNSYDRIKSIYDVYR